MFKLVHGQLTLQAISSQILQKLPAFLSQATLVSRTFSLAFCRAFLVACRPLINTSAAALFSESNPVSMVNLAEKPVWANGFPYPAAIQTLAGLEHFKQVKGYFCFKALCCELKHDFCFKPKDDNSSLKITL